MLQFLCVFVSMSISVYSLDTSQGDGLWSLVDIAECQQEIEDPGVMFEVEKRKINRTHDGISAEIDVKLGIDESFGVLIEVCKYVDGGCKHSQTIADNNVIKFGDKYAASNIQRGLELAGLDPPQLPLPEGKYKMDNFIMDYCEVPTTWFYGKYEAEAFLLKDDVKIACLKLVLEFNKPEDDDDLC